MEARGPHRSLNRRLSTVVSAVAGEWYAWLLNRAVTTVRSPTSLKVAATRHRSLKPPPSTEALKIRNSSKSPGGEDRVSSVNGQPPSYTWELCRPTGTIERAHRLPSVHLLRAATHAAQSWRQGEAGSGEGLALEGRAVEHVGGLWATPEGPVGAQRDHSGCGLALRTRDELRATSKGFYRGFSFLAFCFSNFYRISTLLR